MAHLPENEAVRGFHTLILADLLFNHSEHEKLIKSIQETLRRSPESVAMVFFTPYRPWLLEKDMDFFRLARESGFKVEKVLEKVMDKVLFEKDRGVSTHPAGSCDNPNHRDSLTC
jgi:nicotinamide N-methyltransferase